MPDGYKPSLTSLGDSIPMKRWVRATVAAALERQAEVKQADGGISLVGEREWSHAGKETCKSDLVLGHITDPKLDRQVGENFDRAGNRMKNM